MARMTNEQLGTLAQAGASNREIEAALGHRMTEGERLTVDRARVVARLRKQQKMQGGPVDATTRKRQQRNRGRQVRRRQCENPKRRIKYEKDTPAWLRFYLGDNTYPFPFSDGHMEIIENAEHAASTGTGAVTAAPRGEGKTTVLRGVAVNLVARRVIRFPVLVGWKHRDAKAALKLWLRLLCESEPLKADYPELTQPFEISGHALALKSLIWEDTGERIGASIDSIDNLLVLPDSLAAIAARSAQGDAKGLNAPMLDGTVLRPDLLLLDDAQDPKRAGKVAAVNDTVDTIENVFMGMAGPQKRLTTFAACTVEADNDVSCHFLGREGWRASRIARIKTWPGGNSGGEWGLPLDDKQRLMWDEWRALFLEKGQKACNAYFRKHRKAMSKGMSVSWVHRFEKGKDVCALDAAMWDYYNMGPDVFARGQQNQPLVRGTTVYDITPKLIASRVGDRAPLTVPEWGKIVTVGTDINQYGLHSAMTAFGNDQTAAVMWYGRLDNRGQPLAPKNTAASEVKKAVYEALVRHGEGIINSKQDITLWIIDGGWMHDVVQRYVSEIGKGLPFPVMVARGYPADKYRPGRNAIGAPREECHLTKWPLGKGIAFNQHYWCEVAQRAWLGDVGSPGSCSLFAGGDHREYAEHICREKLVEKFDGKYGPVWVYHSQPGWHDYGDAMYMCYVAAAWHGVGTGAQPAPVTKAVYFTGKPRRR